MTSRHHKEACQCLFDNLVSPLFFNIKPLGFQRQRAIFSFTMALRSDTLYVPSNIVKRLNKNGRLNKGMDIKLAKTNIRKPMGGNLLTSILSMGRALAPTIGKTPGLSALAGLARDGASQLVKKISGVNVLMDFASELNKRVDNRRRPRSNQLADRILASAYGRQRGGFLITLNTIGQLMPYEDLLSTKQKRDLLSAIKTDSDFHINQLKHRCVVALELFLHPLVFH